MESAHQAEARPPTSRTRRGLIETAWLLLVVVVATMLFLARYEDPRRIASGDSFWYMRQTLIFTGVDPEAARLQAAEQMCRDINRSLRAMKTKPTCQHYVSTGFAPRYVDIFDSRPGYPLVAAPFVSVLGLWTGMMAATLMLALLAAALAYLAVWLASGLRLVGVLASALIFVLPSGFAMSRMLTESGVFAGYLAVLLGATLMLRGRRLGLGLGLPIVVVALVWLFLARSASGMAMALTLLAAGAVAAVTRRHRWPGVTIAGLGVLAIVAWQIVSGVLRLPGLNETIQDFATHHFERGPDVADPIGWLIDKNLDFWPGQLVLEAARPTTAAAFAFAVVMFVRHLPAVAALWLVTGLTGVMMLVAHPADSEYHRMMAPIWLPVACAFGYAVVLALGRRGPAAGPDTESPAPPAIPKPRREGQPDQGERAPGHQPGLRS